MLVKPRGLRATLSLVIALGVASGCLVVSPLDELPAGGKSAGGKSSSGPNAGDTSAGGTASGAEAVGGTAAGEGASAGTAGTGTNECVTNAECVKRNATEPYRCRPSDNTCVALKTDACPLAYGDAASPNAIYFGAFATLNASALEDNSIIWSHLLALDELSGDKVGGLPGGADGMRRELVMIVCDNTDDFVEPALSHLVEDVQVPAVLATLKPGDLRRGFEKYRAKHDVFYLSPVPVTSTVATTPDDDLIWSILGQPSDLAPTYAALLKLTEKRLRKVRSMPAEDQLKVVLVTTRDAFDSDLATAVEPLLRFNGDKTFLDNAGTYKLVKLDPDDPDVETQLETRAEEIIDFEPDVILSAASELFSMDGGLLQLIDEAWRGTVTTKPLPFYVLSPYNAGNLNRVMLLMNDAIEYNGEPDPQLRFVGVSVAGPPDPTLQNKYALRLRSMFKRAYFDTAHYYDATYFLAYAMYGAGSGTELSGSRIAAGMRRLLAGDDYDIGPEAIDPTFKALASDTSNIHLVSTLGPPDFDAESGVRSVDGNVFCFERVDLTVKWRTDVLRYNRESGELTGTFPCFSGFFP
jgi:hypothetical protein